LTISGVWRLHNFALFIRPKAGQLVLSRYINSLIRFCKTRGRAATLAFSGCQ
jgi:hypothetical protein